jgi:Putative lumazine-binding
MLPEICKQIKINRMKKLLLFLIVTLPALSNAQDSMAIKKASLDYVEGYYQSDPNRMTKAVHPEIAKRIIIRDDKGNVMLKNMGASELIFLTRKNTNAGAIKNDTAFQATVQIFDISNNIATVKVTTNKFRFIDYLHLGKFNGEWKIVNVLWAYTDQ